MSETEVLSIIILLAVCAGLLLLLLVMAAGSGRRLRRIERSLKTRDVTPDAAASAAAAGVSAPRGEFETFLAEDPARQQLTKGEQFRAYRRWRQDKGLNWSKS